MLYFDLPVTVREYSRIRNGKPEVVVGATKGGADTGVSTSKPKTTCSDNSGRLRAVPFFSPKRAW